jgi:polyphosphate kinase 2 (PPK2 family)
VHRHVPGKGEIVIFNRSHYEDVLCCACPRPDHR